MYDTLKQKQQIAQRFNRAAKSYDLASVAQKRAGNRLFNLINLCKTQTLKIADLGCGTGYFSKLLATKFSESTVIGLDMAHTCLPYSTNQLLTNNLNYICGDFDYLPFRRNIFDLIFSNMALQWSFNLINTLDRINQILSYRGCLAFSIPGPLMLNELITSLKIINPNMSYHHFYNIEQIKEILNKIGFTKTFIQQETFILHYSSLKTLLQQLKNTGVTYIKNKKSPAIQTKKHYLKLINIYENYRDKSQRVSATYDIIYVIANKNHD